MGRCRRREPLGALVICVVIAASFAVPYAAVAADAGFTVSIDPSAARVVAGTSTTAKVTITSLGASGAVTVTTPALPLGVTIAVTPKDLDIGDPAVLTITTQPATKAGKYPITLTFTTVSNDPKVGSSKASTVFTLTVTAAAPDSNLLQLFSGFLPKMGAPWKEALPPSCPASGACTADYSGLPLPAQFSQFVLSDPAPLPTLTFEVLQVPLPQPITCDSTGAVVYPNHLDGDAAGPYPGTVQLLDTQVSRPSLLPFRRPFGFFYQLSGDGFTQPARGLVLGTIVSLGCDFFGRFLGGHGSGSYDAIVMRDETSGRTDSGAVEIVFPSGWSDSDAITVTFTSANLPPGASLRPPTPVCPPEGCT